MNTKTEVETALKQSLAEYRARLEQIQMLEAKLRELEMGIKPIAQTIDDLRAKCWEVGLDPYDY